MKVSKLFVKRRHSGPLEAVSSVAHDDKGIADNVACAPFRQVLIAAESITASLGLASGDLRENVVVDFDGLYDLPSGTVIKLGEASIRLTFHCEPCKQIVKLVAFDQILHKRGVFGTFLNAGTISVGDKLVVTDQSLEPIPYAMKERLQWFLKNQDMSSAALDLVHKIGLPSRFAKVMPRILQRHVVAEGS